MYKSIRRIRIILALLTALLPAWALIAGYESIFSKIQIYGAILSGSFICLIFWVIATLIYGRIYCSFICPLGTTMDCAAATERLISRRRKDFRRKPVYNTISLAFLCLAVAFVLLGGAVLPTLLDPYSAYSRMVEQFILPIFGNHAESITFSFTALAIAISTLLIILCCSWKSGRVLCNTLCPVGTMLSILARRSVYHADINTDKCINCGECERVCKAGCINLLDHTVDTGRCVVCFNCMAVCPNDAITYRQGWHRLGFPLLQATNESAAPSAIDAPKMNLRRPIKLKNKVQ